MTSPHSDLRDTMVRLASRAPGRTEANVQADLHMLLRIAPLNLEDSQIADITLESPAGQRRRIDVEVGFTVFEVKRDLRVGNVHEEAIQQLLGYVQSRTTMLQQRYVGVLTDGAEWYLYHLEQGQLREVSKFVVDPSAPKVEELCVWLEGVLATAEKIVPTPLEISRRLGAGSTSQALEFAALAELFREGANDPSVQLKRELWGKLLTTAFGTSFRDDEDDLFVKHTLLVIMAEIIGHAVVGFDPNDASISPASLLSGRLFASAQIGGVIEADFFDWPTEVPGGDTFVRTLARRLTRFEWHRVEHDVMKVLYESVIEATQRHQLGEYYTPDWLAEAIVQETVANPLTDKVLDPSCGSGTFLFHAVRRYLDAADKAGHTHATAITGVTSAVMGVDVHPVAVTFARVTYLLAMGMDRLRADDRPPFAVPVYLGDSVQWRQQGGMLTGSDLVIPTGAEDQLFALGITSDLRFPERLLADAGRFDRIVTELADKASSRPRHSAVPSLAATFRLYAVHPADQDTLARTFKVMCERHDEGRNHIWGYYVRNLARPMWLAQDANRVDVLIGNPPWLAYRFMPDAMKAGFRAMYLERGFGAGMTVATNQDLSSIFVARCVELYLKVGGRFGFVMPLATLTRGQFGGFRSGKWSSNQHVVNVRLGQPWDLHAVKPSFFPVPASVVFGERTTNDASALTARPEAWSGRISANKHSLTDVAALLTRSDTAEVETGSPSPYASRFAQGATLVPRMLVMVEYTRAGPLGAGAGRRAVKSRRTAGEKRPWKFLPGLTGNVEQEFLHPIHQGDTVLPYRTREPLLGIVPWDGQQLLHGKDNKIDMYPGLAHWWREAEAVWDGNQRSKLSLSGRINYQRGLTHQMISAPYRIVYSASGMYLAAAVVSDPRAVIEHKLYWASASNINEARYLTAVLNSHTVLQIVRPLQSRGEHNPRDFDKYVLRAVPIPTYEPASEVHAHLVELAERAEGVAAGVDLPDGLSFQALRRRVREALVANGVAGEIDDTVRELLGLDTVDLAPVEDSATDDVDEEDLDDDADDDETGDPDA